MKVFIVMFIFVLWGNFHQVVNEPSKVVMIDVSQTLQKGLKQRLQEGYDEMNSKVVPPIESPFSNDVECLIEVVYFESATESVKGKKLVAQTVMNRVKEKRYFPDSICKVVHQRNWKGTYQFSYLKYKNKMKPMDKGSKAYKDSVEVAYAAINGEYSGLTSYKYYKRCDHPSDFFANKLSYKFREGNHCWYDERRV